MEIGSGHAVACDHDVGCITCGDVAVPMQVIDTAADGLVRCADEHGREEQVDATLVAPVVAGDTLLVHAATAIQRLDPRSREAVVQ